MASTSPTERMRIIGTICLLLLFIVSMLSALGVWHASSTRLSSLPLEPERFPQDPEQAFLETNLSRRALPSYADSITKGRDFICAMEQPFNANPRAIPQSTWLSEVDLAKYGWNIFMDMSLSSVTGLDAPFAALGIASTSSEWRSVTVAHNRETRDGSTVYPATFAQFLTLFHGKSRTLVAKIAYGPAFQAAQMRLQIGGNTQLPPLQKWSDIVWLAWQRVTSLQTGTPSQRLLDMRAGLEHVFHYQVTNKDTQNAVLRAGGGGTISNPDEKPPVWPGWLFTPTSNADAFKSILSSPNAYGLVYLLASHKGPEQFKVRTIDRINAFDCPFAVPGIAPESRWCLYLHVTSV